MKKKEKCYADRNNSNYYYWQNEGMSLKAWKQCSKNPFIHHNSLSEMRLSLENCFIIPSEKVGIRLFTLFGTIPTTVRWTWFFVLHSCHWDFIWIDFGWGDMCVHTYEWVTALSISLTHLSSFPDELWCVAPLTTPPSRLTRVPAGLTGSPQKNWGTLNLS